MEKPIISIMVAAAENNVIGRDNGLLWHLPNDLRFFKRTTSGHPVIMGRKTFESLGKPLPNRLNIIVTRQRDYQAEGADVMHSLEAALGLDTGADELFVIGGGEIYRQALPLADRVYLTRVHTELAGDTYFPVLDEKDWKLVAADRHASDERHAYDYTFQLYERTSESKAPRHSE